MSIEVQIHGETIDDLLRLLERCEAEGVNEQIVSVQIAEASLPTGLVANMRFLNAVGHCRYKHCTKAFLHEIIGPAAKMALVETEISIADSGVWKEDYEVASTICYGFKDLVMYSRLGPIEKIEKVTDLIQVFWCSVYSFTDDFEKLSTAQRLFLIEDWDREANPWIRYLRAQFILDGFVDHRDLTEMAAWSNAQYYHWFGRSEG